MLINTAQARVVDPVLTNVARGFTQVVGAGLALFPPVNVMQRGGQIIQFGREDFRQYNLRRAPGANTVRIPMGYAGVPFALVQDALEVPVPREHMQDAAQVPGINLGTAATRRAMNTAMLALELEQANLARNTASYPAANRVALGAGARWSDTTVNPATSINAGREAVRAAIGVYPNTLVISARAFAAAQANPFVLDRTRYTSSESITEAILARLWNFERVVVGGSITVDQADVSTDVWGTDVIMAYTAIGPIDNAQPSFGYTYTLDGNPLVETPYWDNSAKSWIYPVTYERAPVVAGGGAGYLIQTAAA